MTKLQSFPARTSPTGKRKIRGVFLACPEARPWLDKGGERRRLEDSFFFSNGKVSQFFKFVLKFVCVVT